MLRRLTASPGAYFAPAKSAGQREEPVEIEMCFHVICESIEGLLDRVRIGCVGG